MEIKFSPFRLRLPALIGNPLLLIRMTAYIVVLGIAMFLGFSFFRTVYSAVLSPKPVAESQLTSQQATLDTATLDAVTKAWERQKAAPPPTANRDLFLP